MKDLLKAKSNNFKALTRLSFAMPTTQYYYGSYSYYYEYSFCVKKCFCRDDYCLG